MTRTVVEFCTRARLGPRAPIRGQRRPRATAPRAASRSATTARSSASRASTFSWSVAARRRARRAAVLLGAQLLGTPLDARELLARRARLARRQPRRRCRPDAGAERRRRRRRPAPAAVGRRRRCEVLVDAAGQVADRAVAEQRVDVVGRALEEVAVVADHDERAGPGVEQVLEHGEHLDVEVVGRLVEQQHVGPAHEQAQQLQPAALAAGEVAEPRRELVAGEAEALEQLLRGRACGPCRLDVLRACRCTDSSTRSSGRSRRAPATGAPTCTVWPTRPARRARRGAHGRRRPRLPRRLRVEHAVVRGVEQPQQRGLARRRWGRAGRRGRRGRAARSGR